jgi:hypothetical protein
MERINARYSFINNSKFNQSNLEYANFGEYPYYKSRGNSNIFYLNFEMRGKYIALVEKWQRGSIVIFENFILKFKLTTTGENNYFTTCKFLHHRDCLVTGEENGSIKIWDGMNGKLLYEIEKQHSDLEFKDHIYSHTI